jgi:hypothetical protein
MTHREPRDLRIGRFHRFGSAARPATLASGTSGEAMTTPSNSPYTPDLRGFIAFLEKEHPEQVVRISREVDPKFGVSGILERLEPYASEELTEILLRSAAILQVDIERRAAEMLAVRARGHRLHGPHARARGTAPRPPGTLSGFRCESAPEL